MKRMWLRTGISSEGRVVEFHHCNELQGKGSPRIDVSVTGMNGLEAKGLLFAPVGADQTYIQPSRAFASGLPTAWSPVPSPDMSTVPTGQSALAGVSLARSSTSLTAPSRRTDIAYYRN